MAPSRRSRVARLMLKAVRSLPEKEQDVVLEHLFEVGSPPLGAATFSDDPMPQDLRERLQREHAARMKERVVGALRLEGSIEMGGGPGRNFQMIPVRLSEAQHRLLKEWCAEHGFPMAVVVRGLVERFLEDQAPGAA